ncbi:MAG: hypothetical protein AAGK21_02675 [Bacteroidota bacterium]
MMWFSFSMRETYTPTMQLPIEVARTPAGQALREPAPSTATVTLAGEGWDLLTLTRRPPTIRLFADGPTIDVATALQESGLPSGIRVQSIQPQTIELALDTQTRRRLPIRLRQDIQTMAPFDLLRPPQLLPDTVEVTGAQALLGVLDDWPTELMVVDNLEDSMTETVALADTFNGLLSPAVQSTRVLIEIGEFTEGERSLPIEVENLPPDVAGVRFDPERVNVVFRAPLAGDTYTRALESRDVRAVVDYFDIRRDTTDGEVPVSIKRPEGLDIRDVRAQPERVGYFIQRRSTDAVGSGS